MGYDSYRVCNNCIMDTTDPKICFDGRGRCDHCNDYYNIVKPRWEKYRSDEGNIIKIINNIKAEGRGREFDCILGISGGMDSSYMLHKVVTEYGLRPLVFHVDCGWNSEIAVYNINSLIDKLGVDLYTEVINWEDVRKFQLAWFKAGVPHLDIPQDHAFIATLYNYAEKHRIKYILNGGNYSTEVVRYPIEYYYYGTDMSHIKDIISKYCDSDLNGYPFSSVFRHKIYLRYIKNVKVVKPLNYIRYFKNDAVNELEKEYGWKSYRQKHFESRFTAFFEGYWLPKRFGFDVRRVQLSSLILTGQMSREEALEKINNPVFDEDEEEREFEYVATKLRISKDELQKYLEMPKRFYWDYKNQYRLIKLGQRVVTLLGVDRGGIR